MPANFMGVGVGVGFFNLLCIEVVDTFTSFAGCSSLQVTTHCCHLLSHCVVVVVVWMCYRL